MPSISAPGATIPGIQALRAREFEDYTLALTTVADNDTTFVTVVDITGRGILASVGVRIGGTTVDTIYRITIDGAAAIEKSDVTSGLANSGGQLTLMWGFKTACKVEAKLSGAQTGTFHAVTLVE